MALARWDQLGATLICCLGMLGRTAAVWDYTGQLPAWKHQFPDHDCRHLQGASGTFDWDGLRKRVEGSQPSDWLTASEAALTQLSLDNILSELQDLRQPACPFGVLFVAVVRYGACVSNLAAKCLEAHLLTEVVQHMLRAFTVEAIIGTRWPLLAALDGLKLVPYFEDERLGCEGLVAPIIDWSRLKQAILPHADWFHDAKQLVYNRAFQANWVQAMDECTYGFAAVALWKLVVCAETQAECVNQYAILVDDLLQTNDWREVVGNSWRIFGFLARVQRGIMRHEYQLDFLPGELRGQLQHLGNGPLLGPFTTELRNLYLSGDVSISFAGVLESVLAGIPRPYATAHHSDGLELRKLLYITMVFGSRYVPYIPRFVARAAALGIHNLAIFCLDEAAQAACASLPGGESRCIRGSPSILNKFTLPLAYLHLGVDVFWLDFDVFIMRDPTSAILGLAQRHNADLLVSGSFADDCICSGLVFFRSTKTVTEWLLTLLSWMYEHVYTHDQQAFSAFLAGRPDEDNATSPERISSSKLFRLYLKLDVPRWALLDPVVEFASAHVLNTTGWTGDLEDMVIFHFLHGDSEVNRAHSAYGWNSRHGLAAQQHSLLDIFYNQSDESIYNDPAPPHHRSPAIRDALLASRRAFRPQDMLHCGVLQLNPYTPGRLSADG